jgi:Mannosyl-glycoprotein endo-beta-N-acetylglucosaminidase
MQNHSRRAVSAAAAALATLATMAHPASADLPAIKASGANAVPACTTPGRLQAFLAARNPTLDPRFQTIAVDYMREGEALRVRWDYAFFQMIEETGQLSFRNGSRAGDVKPQQNNFAGLGATGGVPGESFPDVATGVRAHLEHVLLYAGEKLASPVAERTRKVQEWGVLTEWQKSIKHPITFEDLAAKWAPKSKGYADGLEQIAGKFAAEHCTKPDPHPEYVALARGTAVAAQAPAATTAAAALPPPTNQPEKVSGAALAKKAALESNGARSGLGAVPPVKMLNAPPDAAPAFDPPAATEAPAAPAAAAALPAAKCRVWTASYGGQRAVIVKAVIDSVANFTVLDVNEGQETREADAFISAYAKGGSLAGSFPDQGKALEKAFELCPEG